MALRRATAPLNAKDFSLALQRLWEYQVPPVFGLAVSGGVDSMALAYMAKQFADHNKVRAVAFTVDHQLRSDSAEEAARTHHVASLMGLEHHTIPLKWPDHMAETRDGKVVLSSPSRLETEARMLRYSALAQECLRLGISHLLTAHTMDDQIEGLLMRLCRGSIDGGISGMRRISVIPGGRAIFGGNQVKVLRPLLLMDKAQLVAVCETNSVPWSEDPTNHDPQFTMRNAIRYILSNPSQLPEVLRPDSLRLFVERQSEKWREKDIEAAEIYAHNISQNKLKLDRDTVSINWTIKPSDYNNVSLDTMVGVVQRLVLPVTPFLEQDLPTAKYRDLVLRLLEPSRVPGNSFTMLGLHWVLQRNKGRGVLSHTWQIRRQPFGRSNVPSETIELKGGAKRGHWSDWKLWDGRIWCRLRKKHEQGDDTVVIRPFRESDRTSIRALGPEIYGMFRTRTDKLNGGQSALATLPVFASPAGALMAIPSLQWKMPGYDDLHYDCRLKDDALVRDRR
ncbi:PP-loop family-domain-containing protein [Dipodascopsis tothii]|uniref:PP-loop family-domain-containing protein n=1 Tax=Dipodascopsis tothii TaxID=44089 RepID=UPI0034CF1473